MTTTTTTAASAKDLLARHEGSVSFHVVIFHNPGLTFTSMAMTLPSPDKEAAARAEIEAFFDKCPPATSNFRFPQLFRTRNGRLQIVVMHAPELALTLTPDMPSFAWWKNVFDTAMKHENRGVGAVPRVGHFIKYEVTLNVLMKIVDDDDNDE